MKVGKYQYRRRRNLKKQGMTPQKHLTLITNSVWVKCHTKNSKQWFKKIKENANK